jgi:hypothetical protein
MEAEGELAGCDFRGSARLTGKFAPRISPQTSLFHSPIPYLNMMAVPV